MLRSLKLVAFFSILCTSLVAVGQANGAAILSDTFTDTNGTDIQNHTPDVPISGSPYIQISNFPATIQSDALQMGPNVGALVNLSSVHPTNFTVSASLEIDTIGGDPTDPSGRGLGLGFFPTTTTATGSEVIKGNSYTGLTLAPNGTLDLWNGGAIVNSVAFGGTFSPTQAYTLSYQVDAAHDTFSNIALSGSTANYSSLDGVVSALNTTYVGLTSSGTGADQVGIIDNFTINSVPEPSSIIALAGIAATGLLIVARRRRKA